MRIDPIGFSQREADLWRELNEMLEQQRRDIFAAFQIPAELLQSKHEGDGGGD